MRVGGPVLAATDLSGAADATLRQGQAIASDLGVPLVVCHVLPESFRVRVLFPQDAGTDAALQDELERKARQVIGDRVADVLGPDAGAVRVEIDSGSAHAGIHAIAERLGASLIVVGPGKTAHQVARSAVAPVLVARASPTGGSVLGATDFSDPALPAVQMAAAEATRRGVGLRLIHCLGLDETAALAAASVTAAIPMPPLSEPVVQEVEAASRTRLAEALARVATPGEVIVSRRAPGAGIIDAAAAVATSLVVVGMRGRSGLARLALGSVAEEVIGHAPCSVLVVPLHPGG